MGGVIPGIINATLIILFITLWGKINPQIAPKFPGVSWKEKIASLKRIWGAILIVSVVLGGIYAGVMTPTEAAAVGSFSALMLMILMHRGLRTDLIAAAALRAARYTGWILMLAIGGVTFGYALTVLRIPIILTEWIATLPVDRWWILIMIQLLLIVMGMLMDQLSMLLITIPVLFPIAVSLGFHPTWFVIIFVINCELANVTPPVGVNLFVLQGVTGESFDTIVKGVLPLIGALVLGMALVMLFPQLALYLPSLMD